MYKLKNTYIDAMIANRLSSSEIDFILYISKFQSNGGTVESVYYKDVCTKIGISTQKFYDILHNLTKKGLISWVKNNPSDLSVTLSGNSFVNVDFSSKHVPGYVNIAQNKFQETWFLDMKAGAKLLYLYSQRFLMGKHMLVENFYVDFCKLFGVVKKTLQEYIHELKIRKLLFISMKRNTAYHYEMTMKRSSVLYDKGILPNENSLYEHNLVKMMERNFKKYLPDPEADGSILALKQIAALAVQKRSLRKDNFPFLIANAIRNSILQQKQEGKKQPVINAALVNKLITITN